MNKILLLAACALMAGAALGLSPAILANSSINVTLRPGGSHDLAADSVLSITNPSLEHDLLGGALNYSAPEYLSVIETDPTFSQENRSSFNYQNKKIIFHFLGRDSRKEIYYKTFGSGLNGTGSMPLSIYEYMQPDPNEEFVWAGDVIEYVIGIKNEMGRDITVGLLEKEFPGSEIKYVHANSSIAQQQPEIEYSETTTGGIKTITGRIVWRNFSLAEDETAFVRAGILPTKMPQTLPNTRLLLPFAPRALENRLAVEKVISENVVSVEKQRKADGEWELRVDYYNPTSFIHEVKELKITKTNAPDMNPANAVPVWSMGNGSIIVGNGEEFRYATQDNSTLTPVYWLYARYSTVTGFRQEAATSITYEDEKTIPVLMARPVPPPAPSTAQPPLLPPERETGLTERPHIEAVKKVERTRIVVGERFEVRVTVKNPRDADAEDITILEYVPEGFDVQAGGGTRANNSIIWKIPLLPAGQEVSVNYSLTPRKKGIYTLPPSAASVRRIAGSVFSNYVIVNIVEENAVSPQPEKENVSEAAEPEAMLVKTITKTDYGYFVRIKTVNTGAEKIRSVSVRDPLPRGAQVFNIMPFGIPLESRIEWELGDIQPGESREVKYSVRAAEIKGTAPFLKGVLQDKSRVSLVFSPQVEEGIISSSPEAAVAALLALLLLIALLMKRRPKGPEKTPDAGYCTKCGTRLEGREYCPSCGKKAEQAG